MHATRRQLLNAGAALGTSAALGAWPVASPAQLPWPSKPVRLVIGYPPGGAADIVARAVGVRLERQWSQAVIYEYKPGAGAALGVEFTARAAPDGYTLGLMDSGSLTIVPNLRKVPYEPLTDLTPLAFVGGAGLVLLCHPSVPAHSVRELIALLKSRPGEYAYSSSGVGSPHHVAGEMFKLQAGVDIHHVPYKGAAPALNDLMGGQIPLAVATIGPAAPFVQAGRVRALGVTSARRSAVLPEVPAIAEAGLPDYEATPWFAFAGPARMPPALVARINSAIALVLGDPEVVAALNKVGVENVRAGAPGALSDLIRSESSRYADVIRRARISVNG
ncbi:MAG: tripartite tricarboxylate transporter substrate binding protein [Burkholderiaceae bacterium]